MAVQVIRATKQAPGQTPGVLRETDKRKVAAYCRVSTDSDEQETSYEAQCRHYTDFITANPDWVLAGIYADEGISGTSTRRREQFNRMIADCEAGHIDMVITKSISRWARNTLDSLKNIRKLKDLGIPVLFEKENINTLDAKGEILITIMSSLAQQESDSISKNVRIGIQYRMQQGKGRVNTSRLLGLTKGEDGALAIVPEEAPLVRRIYREYLEGRSPGMIAARLTGEGIPTPGGKTTWYQSTIVSMLENEKYAGDLLMQKYFVADFLTHKVVRNEGQLPQYLVEDDHEPIVPREVYRQVQGELRRRSRLKYDPCKLRCGSGMALSGRLICGVCGRRLKRWAGARPDLAEWRCRDREKNAEGQLSRCPCRPIREKEAEEAVTAAFRKLPELRPEMTRMRTLRRGEIAELDAAMERLRSRRDALTEQLEGGEAPENAQGLSAALRELEKRYAALDLRRAETANRELQLRLLLELTDREKGKERPASAQGAAEPPFCRDYDDFFRRTDRNLEEDDFARAARTFSNELVIRYLDTVTVLEDGCEVSFKAGITVKVEPE